KVWGFLDIESAARMIGKIAGDDRAFDYHCRSTALREDSGAASCCVIPGHFRARDGNRAIALGENAAADIVTRDVVRKHPAADGEIHFVIAIAEGGDSSATAALRGVAGNGAAGNRERQAFHRVNAATIFSAVVSGNRRARDLCGSRCRIAVQENAAATVAARTRGGVPADGASAHCEREIEGITGRDTAAIVNSRVVLDRRRRYDKIAKWRINAATAALSRSIGFRYIAADRAMTHGDLRGRCAVVVLEIKPASEPAGVSGDLRIRDRSTFAAPVDSEIHAAAVFVDCGGIPGYHALADRRTREISQIKTAAIFRAVAGYQTTGDRGFHGRGNPAA